MKPGHEASFAVGLVLAVIGLLIMVQTIGALIRTGRGTLAPWSPTTRLVTSGMYAHVRNPMIHGVMLVLLGESLALGSWRILGWALAFWAINTVYFSQWEEPALERRFGAEYREYMKNVRRWIPRLRPWMGQQVEKKVS